MVTCPLVRVGGKVWGQAGRRADEHALEAGTCDVSWTSSFSKESVVEV